MEMSGYCPVCGTQIPQERYINGSAVCSCGWCSNDQLEAKEIKTQKTTIKVFIAVAIAMTLVYGHVLSWGPHAGSALALEVGNTFGVLSADGYKSLITACVDTNRWDCAESAYAKLFAKTNDVEVVADLAKLQTQLNRLPEAASTYESYYKLGGKNPDVAYFYGQVLEKTNQDDHAIEMYRTSIEQNPEKLSINATSALVRLLMKQGKNAEARQIITAFHESADNAKGYLNAEAAQLEKVLGPSVTRRVRAKTVVRM